MAELRLRGDFNGLFGDHLCLSHDDTCTGEDGRAVVLVAGLAVTAFESDPDENGNPDELLASGVVEPAPADLACYGSRWVLRIDHRGVRRASDESNT
jgi:hypothetical protein